MQESESEEDTREGEKPGPKHIDTEKDMLGLAEPEKQGSEKGKGKKRGAEEVMERIAEKKRKAKEQAEAQKQWFDLKVNTSVYVTGLPDDIDEAKLAEVCSSFFPSVCFGAFKAISSCLDACAQLQSLW